MAKLNKGRAALGAAFLLSAVMFGNVASAQTATPSPVTAIWKAQQMNFEYRGYSTLYTCQSLRDTLQRILLNVGVRRGLSLQAYACDDESASARFQITLESPVEATPTNVRELTTYDTNQLLVARVNGEQLPTAADLERFPAVWKTVSFARDRSMRLHPSDCELVVQLRRSVLPHLSIQIVRDVNCSEFGNISPPRLTVLALVPAEMN